MVTMSSSTTLSNARFIAPPAAQANLPLLSAVLEGFVDGILVLTEDGTCIHSNQKGRALCRDLSGGDSSNFLPPSLRAMCVHLQESREFYPETLLVLTQEFRSCSGHQIRARIQWLELPATTSAYLLISLENQTYAAHASAMLEAVQYNLTPRERAVWVLRRANRTYDEIGRELYITVNTVKRHLKSIYAKRKEVIEAIAN
ncbi:MULTISPECIES: helix-turn-helix transcriptional regulator [Cyanophyceae]|uniref:helix-turn-helix transcriptional regulator n=1 Tax=Cyanophyceae TaxID=3028117 RepID=UPI00168715DF|nr:MULTISPECIES: helix-turn-helix transcriptional regulator [Cyanophyceae]MBD1917818.1 helix-turn-helix transcriptional regulator [Phormidium sp. FACHB-77]MBD2032936.1 helix-turn-helix transcriptional regulator [Phormidium sp. FACHB-322]MBD2051684.1 helix-turn-helix transcriptional regulator [Leptolyngbya sp. FACHB-60]